MNIAWYLVVWAIFFGGGLLAARAEKAKRRYAELLRRQEEDRVTVRRFRSLKA
ncbi:MAG: hypothetical protein IJN82_05685 [Clostridia bacterium]|nr:hypothetical protein [Clostridia bacterium]